MQCSVEVCTTHHVPCRHVPSGTHAYKDDPRNQLIFIGIRDGVSGRYELVPRSHAKVSVLDSGFMMVRGAAATQIRNDVSEHYDHSCKSLCAGLWLHDGA
eukprot:36881-Pelagomonas_calceolata.AAC.1